MRTIQEGKMTIQAEGMEDDELPNPGIILDYPDGPLEESCQIWEQGIVQHTHGVVSDAPQWSIASAMPTLIILYTPWTPVTPGVTVGLPKTSTGHKNGDDSANGDLGTANVVVISKQRPPRAIFNSDLGTANVRDTSNPRTIGDLG